MRVTTLVCSLLLVAACSDTGTTHPGTDGGAPKGDMSGLGGGDDMTMPPGDDMGPPSVTTGSRLYNTPSAQLVRLTSDDQAVIFDGVMGKGGAVAVGLDGKTSTIDVNTSGVAVHGVSVFSWSMVDMSTRVGTVLVWTAKSGAVTLGTASPFGLAAASDDGAYIAWGDGASDGSKGDVYVAKGDGTGKMKVLTGISVSGKTVAACRPEMAFAGKRVLVSHCASESGTATIDSIDAATGTVTTLLQPAADYLTVDTARANALLISDKGDLSVVPVAGGAATKIDTGVAEGVFTPDGKAVVYRTSDGKVKRSAITAPAPSVLVPSGAVQLLPLFSPDGKYTAYATTYDLMTGVGDLFLVAVDGSGKPLQLADSDASIYGDLFTADSSRALYYRMIDAKQGIGTFFSQPIGGGGKESQHAKAVWTGYAFGGGTKVVYNDNYKAVKGQAYGRADIRIVDVAKGDAPMLVATQAEVDFYLTSKKDKIVYVSVGNKAKAGVYAAALQ